MATLEAVTADIRGDVSDLREESMRHRKRLHDLEGFTKAYLSVQKEARREESNQYRRMANAIAIGGLAMAVAMVALTVATILLHTG